MLRAARELLAVRSPLDAELMVSELLGTWWGHDAGQSGSRGRANVEEMVGEGLVAYAAEQGTPAALALLSGIACLGTPHQAALAEQAALALMGRGVARPAWAEHVGAVAAGECFVYSDPFGDCDEVVCVFSYGGAEPHALVMVVDYNRRGLLRDGWVTSQVDTLLRRCREQSGAKARPRGAFRPVAPSRARLMLEAALALTEADADPPVSKSFPGYHALIRARIRTLPPGGDLRGREARRAAGARPAAGERAGGPGPRPAGAGRHAWSRDRRAMTVAEFLASDEAEELSDPKAASRCADHIVNYGCDHDFGRPLRMSPAKAEYFLLQWLPRKVMLSPSEQHAMPHVLAAWVRWAGQRRGLPTEAVSQTLDAVFDSMGTFGDVYLDPTVFGLDPRLVARLLPDADLEALPRRAFAFPLLRGMYGGKDLESLDPALPDARRTLLAADHNDPPGPDAERHIDDHLALADRLWRGDPPELWEAAQRLLDLGEDRHAVLHALISALDGAGGDLDKLAASLCELPLERLPDDASAAQQDGPPRDGGPTGPGSGSPAS